jgi:hypothetical protein
MEHLLNRLPEKWEEKIIPLIAIHNKFVLGGSLALYILKMMEYDFEKRDPDLDFSLTEPFEEKEFLTLLDFFDLCIIRSSNDYEEEGDTIKPKSPIESLKKDLIILEHNCKYQEYSLSGHSSLGDTLKDFKEKYYKVDFFNKNYLKAKDWFELNYFGTTIKITHPSIILAAKMMYGTDTRVGKQYKHFQDIKGMDWDNYFKIVKCIRSKNKSVTAEQSNGTIYTKYILDKYVFEDIDSELPF